MYLLDLKCLGVSVSLNHSEGFEHCITLKARKSLVGTMVTIVFQKGVAAYVHQVVGGSTRTLTLEMEKWVNWRAMWEVD